MQRKQLLRFLIPVGFAAASFFPTTATAQQAPDIQWQKTFGGKSFESGYAIQQTSDGGFLAAGIARSVDGDVSVNKGGEDIWVVKLRPDGTLEWEKSYGGSDYDRAFALKITTDGGFIIAGTTWSDDGDVNQLKGGSDFWVVKADASGGIQWEKTYGGSGDDSASTVIQTDDGGFVVAGTTQSRSGDVTNYKGDSDIWMIKINPDGQLQWQKTYGGKSQDWTKSVQQTADGGFIIGGTTRSTNGDITESFGWDDVWVIKTDPTGGIEWQKSYGGSDFEVANAVLQTKDGGYMVAGYTWSNDGDISNLKGSRDIWLLKLDPTGALTWEKTYGGTREETANAILQTADGGYVVAGSTLSADGDITENKGGEDLWLFKVDANGDMQWQKTFGGNMQDIANAVIEADDAGLVVVGLTKSTNGDIVENKGETDLWVIRLKGTLAGTTDLEMKSSVSVYPNPATDRVNIGFDREFKNVTLHLFDMSGKMLGATNYTGVRNLSYPVDKLSRGLYLIKIYTEDGVQTIRLIKK